MTTIAELAEALTSSQTAALLQKVIDQNLVELFRKEEPLKTALPTREWTAATYFWNSRNRLPYAQAVTEAPPTSGVGSVSPTQSNYIQGSVPIGHYQVNGDLSKFNIKVATAAIENLLESEMTASTQSMAWLSSMFHIYGSLTATAGSVRPQWDGFERLIGNTSANRSVPNGGAGTGLTLLDLDNMVDGVRTKLAASLPGEDFFFLCSEPMLSKIGRLVGAQRQALMPITIKPRRIDAQGAGVATLDPGIEVPSYRNIPILATGFLTPSGQLGTVTPAAAGTDGSMAAAARFYAVEPITQYGPMYPSQCTVTPTTTNHVTLTFATPAAPDIFGNNQPILQYRVYEGASASTMTLYAVVPATDAVDNAVTTITDYGTGGTTSGVIANVGANQLVALSTAASNIAGDGVNLSPVTTQPAQGYEEPLWLITRKSDFVIVPEVTAVESEILANVNARTVQYALTGDTCLAVRAPQFGFKLLKVLTV